MYPCSNAELTGKMSRLKLSSPTDIAAITTLIVPNSQVTLVSDRGSILAFLNVGSRATVTTKTFAIILKSGELNKNHNSTPANAANVIRISVLE